MLCHGDLNVRHLLVDDAGVPAAVIKLGDVCVGDPSINLSLYWSLLNSAGRAAFRGTYGAATLTDDRLLRGSGPGAVHERGPGAVRGRHRRRRAAFRDAGRPERTLVDD